MKRISYLILLSLFLSACSLLPKSGDNTSLNSAGQIAIPTPGEQGLSEAGIKLGSEVDLSGEGEPELPGVKTPALSFSAGPSGSGGPSSPSNPSVPLVASGRIVPVADKDGKQIIGWRILGEIFNGTKELLENAQMLVELSQKDSSIKNILPESIQSGGFIPLKSGERGVYDILIAASSLREAGESFLADRISIGVRRLADPADLVRLDVKDLKFTPVVSADGTVYKVNAALINNLKTPVVGPLLRFWAVVPSAADQVVAVATWESPQEILAAGQSKKMETTLAPLTQNDRELMATSSAQLSALAAAKILK